MSDTIVPESRIFRIGRECYVVYLGKELDDIRPFLRIGNNRDIPDEVHDVLSTTVVTDDHVGNPLLEILIAPKFHGRYLGDTGVVGTIRRFFKSFDLPTDDVTDYRKVKDGERRHMIWFYSSGNIHLRYDDQVIFDLDRREKEDRHFVRLFEEAKGEFLRNPLRYIRQDFSGQGMVLADGNAFWYEGGEFLSLAAHPGYVARLMVDGIDPDFISASAYNLTREVMDSRDAAVYIGYVKRVRQRRKQLRVITSSPDIQRKLKLLFPERGDVPATLDVIDVSGKRKATFRDSIISRRNESWNIHRAGMPEITFSDNVEDGLTIDIDKGLISFKTENSRISFSPPGGFPVEFIGHDVPENQLIDRYVGFTLSNVKDHLRENENLAVTALERYLKIVRDDISAKKASVSPLLKHAGTNVRDSLKRCSTAESGPSWFFFSNAASILEIQKNKLGSDHSLSRNIEQVAGGVRSLVDRLPSPDPVLPFWGDLYLGEEPCLLWRASKRGFISADITATREINANITNIASLNEVPWHDDLERLLNLIRSLAGGGQGPLTDEQLAYLVQAEQKPSDSDEKRGERAEQSIPRVSERKEPRQESAGKTPEGRSQKSDNKTGSGGAKRRKWPLILLILLLLLLGGAVVWDLTGNAPWGSFLRFFTSSEIEEETGKSPISESEPGSDFPESVSETGEPQETADQSGGEDGTQVITDQGDGDTQQSTGGIERAAESGESETTVDVDVAPKTLVEVKAYLDVDGRIAITEVDIHLAANDIAVLNGYKDLDYKVFTGADPDWIYPGRILSFPGSGDYEIKRGDTIWFLAAREVRVDVAQGLDSYDKAVLILDTGDSADASFVNAVEILEDIAENSKAAAMRELARNILVARKL